MDQERITVSIRRDAAFYLSMLLGDQILSISDTSIPVQLEAMRKAYEHIKEEIEQQLSRSQFVS